MRFTCKLIPLVGLFLLSLGWAANAQLQGAFEAIGPVPAPHSQDVVTVEEFINFTCPHCNNFRLVSKPLFSKYGKRVVAKPVPILFQGQADYPLRLYFIAERAGRGKEIEELIFDATFQYGVNIYDPKIISYLARSAGLADQLRDEGDAKWVNEKIKAAAARADAAGVEATPTLVLNGSLRLVPRTGMQAFVNNLDQVIAELLK
jgi:Thioredoxin